MFDASIFSEIIADSLEKALPDMVQRQARLADVPHMANVVVGMRRSGKTWFFYQEMQRLLSIGIDRSQLLYLNLEDERLLGMQVSDLKHILDTYYRLCPHNLDRQCYLFLDEVQSIVGWETYVRRILDSENLKIYLTGSSSKMLSQDLATSMRGRCVETSVFPFSFREFLKAHGIEIPANLERVSKATRSRLEYALLQYLNHGGFPALTHLDPVDRTQILQSYVDTVIYRDLIERHGLSNILVVKNLIKRLLSDVGERFSITGFYNDLKSQGIQCSKSTVLEYFDYLQEAFLVFSVSIESNSEKRKQLNPKKIYSIDTGLARAYTTKRTQDFGHLLENAIFLELKRRRYQVTYIQDLSGLEIDFLASCASHQELIQVCANINQEATLNRECAPFAQMKDKHFIRTIITLNDQKCIPHEYGDIQVIPAWKWLLMQPSFQDEK